MSLGNATTQTQTRASHRTTASVFSPSPPTRTCANASPPSGCRNGLLGKHPLSGVGRIRKKVAFGKAGGAGETVVHAPSHRGHLCGPAKSNTGVTLAATDRYKLPGTGVLVKALMAAANCFNFSASEGPRTRPACENGQFFVCFCFGHLGFEGPDLMATGSVEHGRLGLNASRQTDSRTG